MGVVDPPVDPIEEFYDHHPYPPPVARLDGYSRGLADGRAARVAHHLIWPARPPDSIRRVLVAGCGTSQAVRHALRRPDARVRGIDVSASSIEHTRALAEHQEVTNLDLALLPIERVAELDERFDHVVCTGVLHHLEDPAEGLRALRGVLAPGGAVTLMVYARYGRTGVSMLQDYCRRLGVGTTASDLADLVAALRELPLGHPLGRLLRETPDFADDDALADALCNPREVTYDVPELLSLVADAGLRFGRWERQAPYLPHCGSISETPHAARIAALPAPDQYAAVELFRGTMVRHTAILFADDDRSSGVVVLADESAGHLVPIVVPTAITVTERVPPGFAAALINRAHTDTDLVLFVDHRELRLFAGIDGVRSIVEVAELADGDLAGVVDFVERLWRHDLVVLDATGAAVAR